MLASSHYTIVSKAVVLPSSSSLLLSSIVHKRLFADNKKPQSNNLPMSILTSPEKLQENIISLKKNLDMKNIALQATGGRSSVSGIRATVFGSTSPLGKHIVNQLGQIGSQVVLPYRGDGTELNAHKVMGDLGQMVPLPYQIRDKRSVERVIKDSNVVINCITKRRESRNFSFHDVHVNATHMIARTAAELGVDRFIQLSHANVTPDSPSAYHRTKYQSEQVARAFYPEATIIRPSICYGNSDWFFERMMLQWPSHFVYPKIIYGDCKLQPCHYLDVARSVIACLLNPIQTAGKTYSIYGDVLATRRQFFERVQEALASRPILFKCYKEYTGTILGPLLKPIYPIQKRIQFLFDFFRWNPNWEFLSYEDIQQARVHTFANYEEDPDLLTMEDLGLKCEDLHYWETKLINSAYDRFSAAQTQLLEVGHYKGFGRWLPNTEWRTIYGYQKYGFRSLKRGKFTSDWNAEDTFELDFASQPTEWKKEFGSDIDGKQKDYVASYQQEKFSNEHSLNRGSANVEPYITGTFARPKRTSLIQL